MGSKDEDVLSASMSSMKLEKKDKADSPEKKPALGSKTYSSLGPPRVGASSGLSGKKYGSLAPPRTSVKPASQDDFLKPVAVSSKSWGKRLDVNKLSNTTATSLAPPDAYGPGMQKRSEMARHDRWDKYASVESPFKDKEALKNHTGAGFLTSPSKFTADDSTTLELLSVGKGTDVIGDEPIKPEDTVIKGLKVTLLPHQVHGLRFLRAREGEEFAHKGGLLCDDMGLGKTVQSMALMLANKPKDKEYENSDYFEHDENFDYKIPEKGIKTTLVVCPVALVSQWASEIKEKAPGLSVTTYHGPSRERNISKLAQFDVVVTTYSVVMSDHGDPAGSPLYNAFWWRVILDEAHTIKNRRAKTAMACFALGSARRWCLTGTPIQNSLDDLQSLLLFLKVSKYSDTDMWKVKVRDVIRSGHADKALEQIKNELAKIMLRRNKDTLNSSSNALKLPEKRMHLEKIRLSGPEAKIYSGLEQKILKQVDADAKNGVTDYVNALVFLLRLRQAACHWKLLSNYDDDFLNTYLGKKSGPPSPVKGATREESLLGIGKEESASDDLMDLFNNLSLKENKCQVCSETIPKGKTMCLSCELITKGKNEDGELSTLDSAKLSRLLTIIESDPSRKTIIFSQFTSMLDLIAGELTNRKIGHVRYQGSMSRADRDQSLEKLRHKKSVTVLLCSLKCGSLGLNLTCASRVILADPWWNPQIQEQAIDRVYRLGQTVPVDVYQLISKNTVEERIMSLQDEKRNLAKAVADGDRSASQKLSANKLSFDELLRLFGTSN